MTPLPAGWEVTTLGEIAETTLGKMLDRSRETGRNLVPYLRNTNVQWGSFCLDDVLQMDIDPNERQRFELRPGDLLVCEGGEVGRCAVWPGSSGYMAYQKALHRVRPRSGVLSKFLAYSIEQSVTTGALGGLVTGSTIKHIPQQRLRLLPVALPPLAEQRRIVATLDSYLSRAQSAEGLLRAAAVSSERLKSSLLEYAMKPLANKSVRLASLLQEPLSNGRSVPTRAGGFPVLRLTALRSKYVDLSERKEGAWSREMAEPFLVAVDDFLVSRGNGTLSLVGRGALVTDDPDSVAFPDTMIRIRVDRSRMLPHFLQLIWNSRQVRYHIEGKARTTAGIYKINQAAIEDVEIPCPSLDSQRRLVDEVNKYQTVASSAQESIVAATRRGRALLRSLLADAFAGRLVPQDPNDEPASVLLERIRAERAAVPKPRRGRKVRARESVAGPVPAARGGEIESVPEGVQSELEFDL